MCQHVANLGYVNKNCRDIIYVWMTIYYYDILNERKYYVGEDPPNKILYMDDYMGEDPLNKMVPYMKKGRFLQESCGS